MKVKCDKCDNFIVAYKDLKRNTFQHKEEEYVLLYFTCEHCKTIYPVLILDKEHKDIPKEMQSLIELNKVEPNEQYINRLYELKEKVTRCSEELKHKFKSGTFQFSPLNKENETKIIYQE